MTHFGLVTTIRAVRIPPGITCCVWGTSNSSSNVNLFSNHLVVSSTNANYGDWADLSEEDYEASKQDLCETTLDCLEKYVPNVRDLTDHVEASTPRTFQHYTRHPQGASFGTKFEGLKISQDLPSQVEGLFHAGSVGIIMSGWLGAINYGVIVANDVDAQLTKAAAAPSGSMATVS
mgnify:CR=1 FL=1